MAGLAFFDVTLTDAIEGPPWGTQHCWLPGKAEWWSTPSYWEPVLGSPVSLEDARMIIQQMQERHQGPAYSLLVAFEEGGLGTVQLAFLKTESGADDLLQHSNTRPPRWWTHPLPPPDPGPPTRWGVLKGPNIL